MSKNLTTAKILVAEVEAYHSVATEMTAAVAMKQSCERGYHVYKDVWAAVGCLSSGLEGAESLCEPPMESHRTSPQEGGGASS